MINNVAIAQQMKYIEAPDGLIIDIDLITKYAKNEVVLITTGSQGEPMSALHRMAFSEHKKVEVGPEDFIIISAIVLLKKCKKIDINKDFVLK